MGVVVTGVITPLLVVFAGWVAGEFAGGAEGRQQRRVLAYLQIARELHEGPERREAERIAHLSATELLETRGTVGRAAAWQAAAIVCSMLALIYMPIVLLADSAQDRVLAIAAVIEFIGIVVAAAIALRRIERTRARQRPRALVVGAGRRGSHRPTPM